jgi:hypothetical protein
VPRPPAQLSLAWRSGEGGPALQWFREQLSGAELFAA